MNKKFIEELFMYIIKYVIKKSHLFTYMGILMFMIILYYIVSIFRPT